MKSATRSHLLLFVFPFLTFSQSVVYSTDGNGQVYTSTVYDTTTTSSDIYATTSSSDYASSTLYTSYTTGSTNDGATTYYSSPTSTPAIQTVPFTGQPLLIGTCAIAQFTMIHFPNGGAIEVPLVGCSDDRPECCPSLNFTSAEPQETGSSSESESESSTEEGEQPTSSWTATTPSPTPTGVMSMLSKAPLTVCPSDMVDIDPVCCPSGFQVYGQVLVGNYPPCVSTLTSVITPDSQVLASITSAVAASLASASTTTTTVAAVSVVVSQVFALGLPCADNVEAEKKDHTHLSTAAKAGIGAGVAVFGLFLIGLLWCCLAVRHRRRKKMKALQDANTAAGGPIRPESTAYAANQADSKHMSAATTMTPGMGSPMMQQQQGHGFGPAFGYGAPQMQQYPQSLPSPQLMHPQDPSYGIHPVPAHMGYPVSNASYPLSQSPPPPFYPSAYDQTGQSQGGYKPPPAEVAGDDVVVQHPRRSLQHQGGLSDTLSQTTSSTAVTGGGNAPYQYINPGGEPKPPVEIGDQEHRR